MRSEYDFSNAKRAKDVPHLAKLQAQQQNGKTRITIMLDDDVLEAFRARGDASGQGYQTLINAALRASLDSESCPVTLKALRALLDERFSLAA